MDISIMETFTKFQGSTAQGAFYFLREVFSERHLNRFLKGESTGRQGPLRVVIGREGEERTAYAKAHK